MSVEDSTPFPTEQKQARGNLMEREIDINKVCVYMYPEDKDWGGGLKGHISYEKGKKTKKQKTGASYYYCIKHIINRILKESQS